MKILLVDDDPVCHLINNKIISLTVDDPEITIIPFIKAREALAYTLSHVRSNSNARLNIFLDLHMPVFNGWDFLECIEGLNDQRISVFILTSSVSNADKDKAESYKSVKDFIVKPLSITTAAKIFCQEKA
ncbi:response regulator [Salegentibacter sp. F14]